MRGVVLLFLLSLWSGGQVDAIDEEVLANVVQEMRRFGPVNRQYAMAVRLTQEQCQNQVKFDLNPLDPLNVQKILNDNKIYTGSRLIAATPLKIFQNGITKTDHAEYRLLSGEQTNSIPMWKLIHKAETGECFVFFSKYSPCLEKCNNPDGKHNIINFMNILFTNININHKAFVFYSVWYTPEYTPETKPTRQQVFDSFRTIDGIIPLYRCDRFHSRFQEPNTCYRCVTDNTNHDNDDCLHGYE